MAEAGVLICAIRLVMLPYGLLAIELEDDDACAMGASPRGGTSTMLAFSRLLMPLIENSKRSRSSALYTRHVCDKNNATISLLGERSLTKKNAIVLLIFEC